jgi:hypothetical protein
VDEALKEALFDMFGVARTWMVPEEPWEKDGNEYVVDSPSPLPGMLGSGTPTESAAEESWAPIEFGFLRWSFRVHDFLINWF